VKSLILLIFAMLTTISNINANPKILWWYDVNDAAFGQTAMGSLNNDGKMNFVFGCYRNDSMIYALNYDGSLLWKFNGKGKGEGCNDTAPIIFDIDQDSKPDVIVPSSCNPTTFCFDGATGEVKWAASTRGSDSPPTIADLDGDGLYEVIHGQFGGYVICINGDDGSIKWEIEVDKDSWIQTAPTIVDLDGDGQLDFVVATWHFYEKNKIYAYRGDNQELLWSLPTNDVIYHGTAVADLTKDGKPEIVIGDYSGRLYVLRGEDGSILWTYDTGMYIGSPAIIGDINGDGECDIVFASGYKVIALDRFGKLIWECIIPNYKTSFRGAILADIDDDSLSDAIFGTSGGLVVALKGTTGQTLWTIDLAAHIGKEFSIDHAPVLADFTGNGLLDIFIVGGKTEYPDFSNNYGRAYAIEVGKGSGPDWTMFQRDIRRRSSLCEFNSNTSIRDVKSNDYIIYPNPASISDRIFIKLHTNLENKNYIIYDITGKSIQSGTLINQSFELDKQAKPGFYLINIDNKIYNLIVK